MAAPRLTRLNLAIRGSGLVCAAGDESFALLGAVGAQISSAHPHPNQTAYCPETGETIPVWTAKATEFNLGDPDLDLAWMGERALSAALRHLSPAIPLGRVLIHMLMPHRERRSVGSSALDWVELVRAALPAIGGVRFADRRECQADELTEVAAELEDATWDAVVFGGVDSLFDAVGTTGPQAGFSPRDPLGQAAAFVVLESGGRRATRCRRLGHIGGIVRTECGECPCTQASDDIGLGRQPPQVVIRDRQHALEGPDDIHADNVFPQVMETVPVVGEVGAATLPLQIILAQAVFGAEPVLGRLGYIGDDNVLICEHSAGSGARGLLVGPG